MRDSEDSEDSENSEDLEESPVDRSFPALFSRNNENGADTKISSSFEAGSRRSRL